MKSGFIKDPVGIAYRPYKAYGVLSQNTVFSSIDQSVYYDATLFTLRFTNWTFI